MLSYSVIIWSMVASKIEVLRLLMRNSSGKYLSSILLHLNVIVAITLTKNYTHKSCDLNILRQSLFAGFDQFIPMLA